MAIEAAEEPIATGMSQDELIARFVELDERVKSLGAERRDIGMQLAGIAFQNKGEQGTVHLTSTGGAKVKVQFNNETEYVTEELIEVSKMLGQKLFDELFDTKIEFKARKRALNLFFNTVHPNERVRTAKELIKNATQIKAKTPFVSVE
jgi:hypothetical protein